MDSLRQKTITKISEEKVVRMVFGENKPYLYIEKQKNVHVIGGHSHDFCQYVKFEVSRQDILEAVWVEILCWGDMGMKSMMKSTDES